MLLAYREFARGYYSKGGQPTKEFTEMKHAARPLRKLFGSTLAAEFGPIALKAVRSHMIDAEGLSRGVINNRLNRLKRIFKWAVSEQLIPPSVYEGLRAVDGLRYGRSDARETDPVKPVPWEWVAPVLPGLTSVVSAMVQLQWLTGMRPCEVVIMRSCDIDRTREIWIYSPSEHKNQWRGHTRTVALGPKAQALLAPFLARPEEEFLFSPRDSEAERNRQRRVLRQTPLPSTLKSPAPFSSSSTSKRERYDTDSYRRAIKYAILKVNRSRAAEEPIPDWCPLQVRHSRATEIRKQFGLEAAQVTFGHTRADVTQVYAERNLTEAIRIAQQIG
ncbi:tyrosine-type recombinase/integrase [Planctomicrobium sp. SH661]|uniref:tyrosine-type recombinase/integrase n=1 Tax=Planctomicrobium sp. SH661 TaxID=3448124 RepID=UPI003F5C958D